MNVDVGCLHHYHFHDYVSSGGIGIGAYLVRLFCELLRHRMFYTWYVYFQSHSQPETALWCLPNAYM
jgi:hypothetical protein